jgi:hypothetical protein
MRNASAGGELLTIVNDVRRPPLAQRGQLMFAKDIIALLNGAKTRHWVNHFFLPSKKVKIGRTNAWWECDVTNALDSGDLSA